ncbi:hypothetical protein HCN44_007197 [Aphidius gifuensis]|uniref:Uncharacterized protein n=1 Tax=Aphidius gifuensis TaxID=684658 RepID=A0A834XL57_APHGI|nr:hypothetical protein HCN44_007197 [Aphidius gifuensis]
MSTGGDNELVNADLDSGTPCETPQANEKSQQNVSTADAKLDAQENITIEGENDNELVNADLDGGKPCETPQANEKS